MFVAVVAICIETRMPRLTFLQKLPWDTRKVTLMD
jgi:hypothetical protein